VKALALRLQASLAELTPEQIALVLSVGLVAGVFPMMGIPTVLCLLAAFGLRLNFAALQLVNNVSSPLQLALLLPLARAGRWFCGGVAPAGGSWTGAIGLAALHAVTGWACVCVPLGAVLYASLIFFLRTSMCRPAFMDANQTDTQ
jgi:uncharacterized protein (DUF2062 family)